MTSSKCNDDNTIQPRDVIVSINDKRNQSIELRWVLSLSLSLSRAYYLSRYDGYRWMAISLSRRFDWYVNYSCFYSWLVFNYRIDRERIRYTGVLIGRNFDQRERESYTRELDKLTTRSCSIVLRFFCSPLRRWIFTLRVLSNARAYTRVHSWCSWENVFRRRLILFVFIAARRSGTFRCL